MTKFNKQQRAILSELHKNNGDEYNMLKAAEECQELGLVLMQKVLKKIKVPDQAIIDEIGDVKIRLKILDKMFSKQEVQKRVNHKLAKFKEYQDHKLYSKI